jgi:hypothetical protein
METTRHILEASDIDPVDTVDLASKLTARERIIISRGGRGTFRITYEPWNISGRVFRVGHVYGATRNDSLFDTTGLIDFLAYLVKA